MGITIESFGCVWVAPRCFQMSPLAKLIDRLAQFFGVLTRLPRLLICGFSVRFRGGSPSLAPLVLVSSPRLQASWLRASRSPNMHDSEAAHHFTVHEPHSTPQPRRNRTCVI